EEKASFAIDLYHITPFGYKNIPLRSPHENLVLFDTYDEQGSLLLGLDNYPEAGYLNLFFHLLEGRVEDYIRDIPEPRWQFLAGNNWYDFGKENIISDTTGGFIQSGIVRLRIPREISRDNTILSGELFWIKVSV